MGLNIKKNKQKQILYVTGRLDLGGAEKHLLRILPALADRGYEVSIYTLASGGSLEHEFITKRVNVISPPNTLFMKKFSRTLYKVMSLFTSSIYLVFKIYKMSPWAVHFFLPEAYIIGGGCSFLFPSLIRIMSRRSLNNYQKQYPLISKLECYYHTKMSAIIGNSKKVNEQLIIEGVRSEILGLIYNGIQVELYDVDIDVASKRKSLGLSQNEFVLIYVANLINYKGHVDLIDAMSIVDSKENINWKLLCVGRDDGIGDNIRAKSKECGLEEKIIWLGSRDDVAELYKISDLGLMCSHQEGFSNSLIEGMASGLPMIATDVGGNSDAVINTVTGMLVPPHSPIQLSSAIIRLIRDEDQRLAMGANAKKRVHSKFTLEQCVNNYDLLYSGLLKKGNLPVFSMLEEDNI